MAEPLVSIIIPVYNAAYWLQETLDSAIGQSWRNIEVIVVDDGSTDNSLEIAKYNESRNLSVISQVNRGACAARNTGLNVAQGDLIQFLDADDILARDKIEIQFNKLNEYGDNFIASSAWSNFRDNVSQCDDFILLPFVNSNPSEFIISLFERKVMVPPVCWLVPRNIINSAGAWNESLSLNDDREYFSRVVLKSDGVLSCNDAKSYYRIGDYSSLSRTRTQKALESAWDVTILNVQHLLQVRNDQIARSACATELVGFAASFHELFPESIKLVRDEINRLKIERFNMPFGGYFSYLSAVIGWENTIKLKHVLK